MPKSSDLRLRLPKACGLLFCLAFLAGLVQVRIQGQVPFGDGYEMILIAESLVRTGEFGNLFVSAPTGPTAFVPPAYPFLLSLILRIGGKAHLVNHATLLVVFFQAAAVAMLPLASRLLWGNSRPGTIAGLISLVPPLTWIMPAWDANVTVACLVGYCALLHLATLRPAISFIWAVLPFVGAATLLLSPSTLLVLVPASAFTATRMASPARLRFRQFAVWWLLTFVLVLPWAWRNCVLLGSFSLKNNLGITLVASNNDCARATLYDTRLSGCYDSIHPNWNREEVAKLTEMGESNYDRYTLRVAIGWIQTHPGRFAGLTLERVREFWFPNSHPMAPPAWPLWVVTALSWISVAVMWQRRRAVALLFISIAALYPPVYYIVVADMRYRYPIVWLSALAVGYLGSLALEWARLQYGWGSGLRRYLRSLSRSR